MTSPNLRARWIGDDDAGPLFGCEHVDPNGNAWTVCEGDGCAHRDEVSAVRCGELTLDDRAITLRGIYARSIGDARQWALLCAAEVDGWRLVALASMHGGYRVDGV